MRSYSILLFGLLIFLSITNCTDTGTIDRAMPSFDIDLSKYPSMNCKVKYADGNFLGYIPPRNGESFHLDFSQILNARRLDFNQKTKSYIALFEPLRIETVTPVSKTEFSNMRLTSRGDKGQKISLDIQRHELTKPVRTRVWITQEDKIVQSAVLMECTSE